MLILLMLLTLLIVIIVPRYLVPHLFVAAICGYVSAGTYRVYPTKRARVKMRVRLGPSIAPVAAIVPVARYNACEIIMAVYGVLPVSAVVQVFPAGTYYHICTIEAL